MCRGTLFGLFSFVLELHFGFGWIAVGLAGIQLHFELRDLRHTQVAQCFRRALDRRGSGSLPGLRAGPAQLAGFVDALGHVRLLVVLGWSQPTGATASQTHPASGARRSPRPRTPGSSYTRRG